MKILYVTASPVPSQAANSVHVVKMAQALKNSDHDITLLSPFHHDSDLAFKHKSLSESYGIQGNFKHKIFNVQNIKGGVMLHALRVALYAKISNVDIVFSRCLICAWVTTILGIPTIFERHDSLESQSNKVKRIFNRLIRSPKLLKIVVITEALKDHLAKQHNIPEDKFIVAADAADPLPDNAQNINSITGNNRPAAGYIGHLYKGRGIDIIIEMAKKMPHTDFHIVGGKPDDLKYWQNQTVSIDNVIFHGHLPHSQTPNYLKSFDYLLAPYQKKVIVSGGEDTALWMSPLKIFEYMSAGKPILCSDIEVLREVMHDQKNCLLCIPDKADDWCQKLNSLINDKKLSQSIADKALKDFQDKYTWQSRADNIISIATNNTGYKDAV